VITVLIAEDQAMVRGAIASLLGLEDDIEVVAEVGRGDDAVDRARTLRPDVALLDIEMPGLDGLAAAAELARELPETRTLILTTFGRPGYLRRAIETGVGGFMLKDAPADQLADAIREVNAGGRVIDPGLAADASPTASVLSPNESMTSSRRRQRTQPRQRSQRACTSPRGRCGTTSAQRFASSGRATAPRRSGSPRRRAGFSERSPAAAAR
jgi:two-component system, NarL family, response regulator DesR